MALKMSPESQLLIFTAVSKPVYELAKGLQIYGVIFSVGGNTIFANCEDIIVAVSLPVSTSSLIASVVVNDDLCEQISSFLVKVCNKLGKSVSFFTDLADTVESWGELTKGITPPAVKEAPMLKINKPTVKSGVVKLAEAEVIGQQVSGTSAGSIYECVALNPRVKLAVRIAGNTVSFRAEGTPNADEAKNLEEIGLVSHGDYHSLHIDMNGVPPRRVVGALVFGSNIKFDQVGLEVVK